jgi:phosphoribosylamine--glycine ligase
MLTVAEGGSLGGRTVEVRDGAAVTTVVASGGYPGAYEKGRPITIPEDLGDGVIVFHAGTAVTADGLVTSGGRVLAVTALAHTVPAAADASRQAAARIDFEDAFFRTDIGWRERERIDRHDLPDDEDDDG